MNRKFGWKSLAFKLMSVNAVAITALMAVTFTVVIFKVRERTFAMIIDQAHIDAKATAEAFSAKISTLAGATDFFAGTVAKGLEADVIDRTSLTAMLPSMIEKSTLIFGAWFMEPPLGFDGDGGPVSNPAMGTNKTGLFIPYWTRSSSGLTLLRPDAPDYTAEYYNVPATTGKATATEPYVETNADNMMMMSITSPVRTKEKLHGVLGIDLGLGALAGALKNERPFGSGRVYLLSASGRWLTAPSDDLIMQVYSSKGIDLVKAAMKKGEIVTIENVSGQDGVLSHRIVYPFELAGLGTRWYIVEDVPVATISAIVNEQSKVLAVGGVAVLLAVMIALYIAVRWFFQTPMKRLLDQVGSLSSGNYGTAVSGQGRGDEIGTLATSLERFRVELAEGRKLEETAERERRDGEAERANTEEQRRSTADNQRWVVEALGRALSRLSNGFLGYRIQDDFPADYGELRENFNAAAESLRETILRFNETIITLNSKTGDISRSTEQMSKRTEHQAATVEETAAALNEISNKLNDGAKNAMLAADKVEGVCSVADSSGEIVSQAISAMERIDNSSRQVSQIIGVIDEIAFQTNLLALNAGVEAARAGEAGKGFAVVAQEVRELAQRSAAAAKEIKSHILASGDQVRQGVALVGQTGEALGRIVDQVQVINGLIRSISRSADEQASGLREVNVAVRQMDEVTQRNAAMVEETTAASSTLNAEARSLSELLMKFDLECHSGKESFIQAA